MEVPRQPFGVGIPPDTLKPESSQAVDRPVGNDAGARTEACTLLRHHGALERHPALARCFRYPQATVLASPVSEPIRGRAEFRAIP